MPRLHICQDETGFWQLTLEEDDGHLSLLSHQFPSPDHLIDDARELVREGKVPNGIILIAAPVVQPSPGAGPLPLGIGAARAYVRPAPRRVA